MVSVAEKATAEPGGYAATAGVRAWLYALAALVFLMVMVGGATRLTDSGLSITEWQPIMGAIPPLSEADWREAFAKYKQTTEFRLVNPDMTLPAFKTIYWWEWTHRFLGRFIGLAFLLPFLFFWFTGRIGAGLMPKLLGLFVLGGLQGALGWYMVMSGLADRVDVSQYRLAAHLGLAVLIFGAILWVAFDLDVRLRDRRGTTSAPALPLSGAGRHSGALGGALPPERREVEGGRGLHWSAAMLATLIFVQICLGGLVAGLDAGQGYNTWPLMEGALIPDGLGAIDPWYLNPFENALTVQFQHRMLGYLIAFWTVAHALAVWRRTGEGGSSRRSVALVLAAVVIQVALGIWTLLAQAPLSLSLTHQAVAVILFGLTLRHLHATMKRW